ncbi:hypothetical protein [Dendronalium sp. ChiSLP03b]|uniref:hypothetical protein n=1 Tax=Dendronalium sp. ChiSLP03b TaxID=3075381 RepID=UPI00391BB40B
MDELLIGIDYVNALWRFFEVQDCVVSGLFVQRYTIKRQKQLPLAAIFPTLSMLLPQFTQ